GCLDRTHRDADGGGGGLGAGSRGRSHDRGAFGEGVDAAGRVNRGNGRIRADPGHRTGNTRLGDQSRRRLDKRARGDRGRSRRDRERGDVRDLCRRRRRRRLREGEVVATGRKAERNDTRHQEVTVKLQHYSPNGGDVGQELPGPTVLLSFGTT